MSSQEQAALAVTRIPQASPPSAWQRLFSGQYRIAGWYDRGGRRYVIARPHGGNPNAGLTERQRRFLAERARGTALKVMAMETGVSIGTVSRDLSAAMARLGLTSDADLAAVFGHGAR